MNIDFVQRKTEKSCALCLFTSIYRVSVKSVKSLIIIFFFFYFSGPSQVRFAHTDVQYPDFSDYRKPRNLDNTQANDNETPSRNFSYMLAGGKPEHVKACNKSNVILSLKYCLTYILH